MASQDSVLRGIPRQQSKPNRTRPTNPKSKRGLSKVFNAQIQSGSDAQSARLKRRPDARLNSILRAFREYDKGCAKSSQSRQHLQPLNDRSRPLNHDGRVVSRQLHHHPSPSPLIWGGIMRFLQVVVRYPAYFEKLIQLLEENRDLLRPFPAYAESAYFESRVNQDTLNLGYGDLLNFFDVATSVFVDPKRKQRGGVQAFEYLTLQPFEESFSGVTRFVDRHVKFVEFGTKSANLQPFLLETQEDARYRRRTLTRLTEIEDSMNRKETKRKLKKRRAVLDWLPRLSFKAEHENALSSRHAETGSWLLEREEFQSWVGSSTSSLLWCHGKPGSGKSVLASIVLEHVKSLPSSNEAAIAFAYCNFRQQEKCRSENLVLSLMHQILRQEKVLPAPLEAYYDKLDEERTTTPTRDELSEVALALLESPRQKIIVLDGLDECVDPENISALLKELVGYRDSCVKIFATSRSENADIKAAFNEFESIVVDSKTNRADIQWLVREEIERLIESGQLHLHEPSIQDEIATTLIDKADGMFLWVKLQLESICCQGSDSEIREALNDLPYGLDEVYQRALETIAHQSTDHRRLARKVLTWTLYAGRPLHITELLEALAVKPGQQRMDPVNRLSDPSLITSVCAGLVVTDKWGYIQIVHASVQSFFLCEGKEMMGPLDFHLPKDASNVEISQALLTYLMHDDLDIGDAVSLVELSDGFRTHPLALYAAAFWADHIRGAGEKALQKLLLATLENPRPNSSPMRILFANSFLQNGRFDGFPKDSNPLHILVSNNLAFSIRRLPKTQLKKYLNQEDCDGESPLLISTRENMSSIAEFLVKAGAKIHHRSPRGLDSLHRASMHGDERIVRLLLDADGNPNVQTREGTTIPSFTTPNGQPDEEIRLLSHAGWNACHAAAYHGRTAVVKMLIEANVNVNALSEAGWTAIYEAISNNHPRIVEQLIMASADIHLRRQNGESVFALAIRLGRFTIFNLLLTKVEDVKTPIEGDTMLNKAALSGNLAIVDSLIARGADLNAHTEDKASFPLYSAAWKGHDKIVERLIKAGADVNITKTTHYATALLAAVQNNQKKVVDLLLEAGADPKLHLEGWTILHCATQSKNLEMVNCVLSTNPDVNCQGSVGRTPLQNACEEGCSVEILQKLLEAGADPHQKTGEHERSALYYAALNGHEPIVKWLLVQGVDVDAQNDHGDAPINLAAVNGWLPVVKLLLKAGATVDVQNKKKRTALLDAASCGHSAIAEILIQAGANVEVSDIYQFTALSLAAGNNRWAILNVLLEAGAKVDGRGSGGWTGLMAAARSGYDDIMRILLKKCADVRAASDDGNCALHLAAENGHVGAMRILVEEGALVNAHEKGRTALFEAAKNGHVEAIRFLLSVGGDPTIRIAEERYVTPIQCAASYDHPLCVKEFLKAGVSIDLADAEGCTSLHYAGRFGRASVIEMLLAEGANTSLKTKTPHGCQSALDFACMNGHIEAVRVLTAAGYDVNARNQDGVVPLHWAAFFGHTAVVEHLLAAEKIEVDAQTRDGMTPAIDAAMNDKGPVLDLLLAAGANVHLTDENGRNAMHYTAKKGHTSLLKPLLAKGLDINQRDSNNWTPLQTAAWHGHVETMEALIEAGADISMLYANDLSLLHLAIQADQPAVVSFLIKDKTTLEFKTSDSWTPLYSASWAGKVELAKLLLGAGAELESKNFAQNLPLHIAAYKGHADLVSYFLNLDDTAVGEKVTDQKGEESSHSEKAPEAMNTESDPADKITENATSLETTIGDLPIAEKSTEAIATEEKILPRQGPPEQSESEATEPRKAESETSSDDKAVIPEFPTNPSELAKRMINTSNADGETPLHSSTIHGHTKVSKILLSTGADCNAQRDSGATPLHLAARGGHLETVQLLLDHGADPNLQNKSGRTPLNYASEKNNEAIAKALLDRGANPNLLDKHGRSPLQRSCAIGAEVIAKMILAAGGDPFCIDDMGRSCEDWSHLNGVDLGLESGPAQEGKKRRRRDATIKKLLDEADLSKSWGFDVLGRMLMYDGRDLDAQICFEQPARLENEDEESGKVIIIEDSTSDPLPEKAETKELDGQTQSPDEDPGTVDSETAKETKGSENPNAESSKPESDPTRNESHNSEPESTQAETDNTESELATSPPDSIPPETTDISSEPAKTGTTPRITLDLPPPRSPSTPPPLPPHLLKKPKIVHRACCDGCPDRPRLVGIRYVCRSCEDRDLCESCMEKYGKEAEAEAVTGKGVDDGTEKGVDAKIEKGKDGEVDAGKDGEVNVPGCKGHKFLRVPQVGWEDFEEDVVTASGMTELEWLIGMRAEWGWKGVIGGFE